ncbi:GntR family transcriptional regulator [Enterococcus canis]|uniref:GntR family transcriptional regulator n=1 Tax=Enterococcus canis TaxID=214095 RepID=A0A1L8RFI4_9ENTE|nr:GntR family transcriptional regulator [Enterococcus canis]OJG18455.1 GntR family transcriptional regulator [Enterococcus canis]
MQKRNVLYLEIAEQIKQDILAEKYPVGSMLPTEAELEQQFGVSKITIRKAIEMLAADEYLEKKSGKGTTVLSNRPYNRLSKGSSFSDILDQEGEEIIKKNLSFEIVDLAEDHPAQRYFGDRAVKFRRLYELDHQPYIYYEYYLPLSMQEVTLAELAKHSMYWLMNRQGIEIETFRDSFQVVELDLELQKFMITPETSGLKRIRHSYNRKGAVVEYSEGIYNTALHSYVIEYHS